MRSLRERWIAVRNRLIADPRFQRIAARLPGTRTIARGHAGRLFDLVAGFTYSQILLAFVQLELADWLAGGPQPAAALANRANLSQDAADRLLRAATALGLAERLADGRYALGLAGAALRGNPGIAAMVAHHPMLYADLADPVALLRNGRGQGELGRFWSYAGAAPGGDAAAYSALMTASQALVGSHVVEAYRFARHRRMLDIGGGEGRFLETVAASAPQLALGLFDLPQVAARAATRLGERISVHPGDFSQDPLPPGHDLITLIRVLHDHDDAVAQALLVKIRAALSPGGRLLIAEPMAETRGAEAAGDGYFGLYLWAMGSGRPRSANELRAMLAQAGFATVREIDTPIPLTVRILVATA
ncbi:methyltransferase [Sphingomonas sp. 1P06PA]|uniref:methyltransferase n=1 Tax=Sphingomonas sp. 1P06PA TaxID=554121 RepID=UPI0039A7143D